MASQATAWNAETDGSSFFIDTTRAHLGAQSLRVHLEANNTSSQVANLSANAAWPVGKTEMWARAFFYVPSPGPSGHGLMALV